jgi:hypothetical protein
MGKRIYLIGALMLIALLGFALHDAMPARADSPSLMRTQAVQMTYVRADNYKNRLINARAAFDQMQVFFDKVEFKRGFNYSFLRDVLHGSMMPSQGYVNTPKGYAYGACGATSVLNQLVQTATFRDSDGKEKPVFQTIMIWTWKGDKTYGKYGATIFLDPTGVKNKDYIWRLNPAYDGPPPKITGQFDMDAETVYLTMTYADEPPRAVGKAQPTQQPADPGDKTDNPTVSIEDPAPEGAASAPPTSPDMPPKSASLPEPPPDNLNKTSRAALLTQQLTAIIGSRKFGVSILPIGEAADSLEPVGVNPDTQLFVASAFKGPVAMYFFENVDKKVWSSVPIKYWGLKDKDKDQDKVPLEYRADWLQYHDILRDMYWMAVYSENEATGDVLMYVWQNTPQRNKGDNALIAFNNWSRDVVGAGPDSGLHLWLAGRTACRGCVDERYGRKFLVYGGKILTPNNTYSPRDLARFYVYLATTGRELGYYKTAVELLSTTRQQPGMLEYFTGKAGIEAASKDGFVGPYSEYSDGYYISTDAGLLTLADGKQYAVAFMAFDAGDLMADSITTTIKMLLQASRSTTVQQTTAGQ